MLAALPFFHVFAMTAVMNFAVAYGAEIVIMPRFVLDDAMKLIDKTQADGACRACRPCSSPC